MNNFLLIGTGYGKNHYLAHVFIPKDYPMIKSTNLKEARHAEYCETLRMICDKLLQINTVDERLEQAIQTLVEKVEDFTVCISKRREWELTPELKVSEKLVMEAYCALVSQVKGLTKLPVPEVASRAAEVYAFIEDCGKYAYRESYLKRTGTMTLLVEQLAGKYSEQVEELGLQRSVACLQEMNEEFQRIYAERLSLKSDRQQYVAQPRRRAVQEAFQELCDLVEAGITWWGDEAYRQMAEVINVYVRDMQWTVNMRKGKRKARKEREESPTPAASTPAIAEPAPAGGERSREDAASGGGEGGRGKEGKS